MIKKIVFCFIWCIVIFIVSYCVIGIPFVLLTPGTNQAKREAALAFRDTYIVFFAIGALILAIIGTIIGILPGTKKKSRKKKKASTEKKAHKKK
jgi:formate-dependent nitrite reductase membrane component NrfD